MNRLFAYFIVGDMLLGVVVGWICNATLTPDQITSVAGGLGILTDLFLRLIKMIIAPLVFATLVSGIAHMEDAAQIGRVGVKTMGWFICASLVSLTIGLIMVHIIQPGVGMNLAIPAGDAASTVDTAKFTLKEFVTHLVPTSIIDAMAKNEIIQIVVFSVLVGTAVSAVDDRAPQVLQLVEQITAALQATAKDLTVRVHHVAAIEAKAGKRRFIINELPREVIKSCMPHASFP